LRAVDASVAGAADALEIGAARKLRVRLVDVLAEEIQSR